MSKKNKVYALPESLRKQLNKYLLEGKSIEVLHNFINKHAEDNGITISKSGLGRYKQAFDKEMQDLADIDYMLQKLPENISFDKESNVHKLIAQILSNSILKQVMGREEIETKELFFLSKSLKEIMSSSRDREKIREQIEKEVREKTLIEVEKAAKGEGLSDKTIANLRKALGA